MFQKETAKIYYLGEQLLPKMLLFYYFFISDISVPVMDDEVKHPSTISTEVQFDLGGMSEILRIETLSHGIEQLY